MGVFLNSGSAGRCAAKEWSFVSIHVPDVIAAIFPVQYREPRFLGALKMGGGPSTTFLPSHFLTFAFTQNGFHKGSKLRRLTSTCDTLETAISAQNGDGSVSRRVQDDEPDLPLVVATVTLVFSVSGAGESGKSTIVKQMK